MQLTPEEIQTGTDNFNEALAATRSGDEPFEEAVALSRRSFIKGTASATVGLGAAYFGYSALKGDPVKVGFIGTGDEGSVLLTEHPPAYMNIVAIADLRPTNRQRAFTGDGNDRRVGLNKKLGKPKASRIKVYEDHRQLLDDPDVEAVVIAVPLSHHAPIAIEAMKKGKHVLTEKLMAHSIQECKQMIEVARKTDSFLAVGHQRHYSVLYDNANFLVKQGILGDIRHIRAQWHRNNSFPGRDSWRKPLPAEDVKALDGKITGYDYRSMNELVNWRLYNRTGGGLMAELGSHQMDACSIFLGKVHPLAVQGYGGKNFYGVKKVGSTDKQDDDREIDDHVYVTFEFPGKNYHKQDNPDDVVVVTY
ncbi:MAG: Gfo/Idh/MocA family oxidoreductase, partial [Planctomycetaceae bacterium]